MEYSLWRKLGIFKTFVDVAIIVIKSRYQRAATEISIRKNQKYFVRSSSRTKDFVAVVFTIARITTQSIKLSYLILRQSYLQILYTF